MRFNCVYQENGEFNFRSWPIAAIRITRSWHERTSAFNGKAELVQRTIKPRRAEPGHEVVFLRDESGQVSHVHYHGISLPKI